MSSSQPNSSNSTGSDRPRRKGSKRTRPALRQATLILPKTGERVHRSFTLQLPSTLNGDLPSPESSQSSERSPLLPRQRIIRNASRTLRGEGGREAIRELIRDTAHYSWEWIKSPSGISVLKCSIAYVLGSLATFVPFLSQMLGSGDGKHMVATVAVYFHPARSVGSMIEAILLASAAFLYAALISITSMAVSLFFGNQDLMWVGHMVVLVVFCGGGLGLVGWTKQRLGNPLVNVACSLASLTIIQVLTREDAIKLAYFSYEQVVMVLKIVLLGVLFSCIVSFTIKPRSARNDLKQDLVRVTDHLEIFLTLITRGFLSGNYDDCSDEMVERTEKKHNTIFASLVKNLREAKFEHYVLGTERIHELEVKLVKCIEHLAQDLDGLRSAASTQFALIKAFDSDNEVLESPMLSPNQTRRLNSHFQSILEPIEEVSERPTPASEIVTSPLFLEMSAADIFSMFISQLGPPMKSLAFTIKGVLNDLPFGPAPEYDVTFNHNFINSLTDAKDLFITARRIALDSLYSQRSNISSKSSIETVAEYEEVAASCGYFSSSLEDFAEDTITYLEVLSQLKHEYETKSRSWSWLLFWIRRPVSQEEDEIQPPSRTSTFPNTQNALDIDEPLLEDQPLSHALSTRRLSRTSPPDLSDPHQFSRHALSRVIKYRHNMSFSYRLYRATAVMRREDVKYAIKVGIGAILYAMWSFIPSTRPIYSEWRGEWGLLSYMLVCSMTIGASNTTGLHRFLGTCLGAILALLAWSISGGNGFVLGFFGWLVSLGCFYIIIVQGRGPLGRFIFLSYNLSALYGYSRAQNDTDDDNRETAEIYAIALHRVVAVLAGCIWGMIVTRVVWPISARKKIKNGLALLWLRMSLIWKRDPLQMLLEGGPRVPYVDIREEISLRRFLRELQALKNICKQEFDLRGPFPESIYRRMLDSTSRILGAFHAMQVVIMKDLKASRGEAALLRYTRDERSRLSRRICQLLGVCASEMKLEYPIADSWMGVEEARGEFLARLWRFRSEQHEGESNGKLSVKDEDFELLYAYGLATGQIAKEIEEIFACIELLYGLLDEESLKLT